MSEAGFDIARIVAVLQAATGPGGRFSQRGLSRDAGETRDCVGDIIHGRNRNPTLKVLANLARAMGEDLAVFGVVETRAAPPTESELEAAIREMLPGMPRGSLDRRARYLAETVAQALKLPPGLPASGPDRPRTPDAPATAVPPRAATN